MHHEHRPGQVRQGALRILHGEVRQRLLGQDVPLAGVGIVIHQARQPVLGELIELLGGEDLLPQDRLRPHDGAHEHRRAHMLGPRQERRRRPETVGVDHLPGEAQAGQPAGGRPQVLGLARQRDDVVVGLAQTREVQVERGQTRLAVAGTDPVQAPALAVTVGEEVVRQQDHALRSRLWGLGVLRRRRNLQIDRGGSGRQLEGAGQGDPAWGIDADVVHGVNLRQKIGVSMGDASVVLPIALRA